MQLLLPRSVCLSVVFLITSVPVCPQDPQPHGVSNSHNIAAELLRLPLRSDAIDHAYWDNIHYFIRPPLEPQPPPDASSPLRVLARYWQHKFAQDPERLPLPLRWRLLEACEAYPEFAADLAHLLPGTPGANRRLFALLDRLSDQGDDYSSPRRRVMRFLSQNGDWFRPLLIAHAQAAYEGTGFIENEDDVRALARLDWGQAAPLLSSMLRSKKPRMTALALGLQYQHAVQTSAADVRQIRSKLQAIVGDKSAPAKARDLAVGFLMAFPWPGQEHWFLALLADPSLAAPDDDQLQFSTLEDPVHKNPFYWIPRIAPLVDDANAAVRKNVVYILVSFQQEEVRPDAAVPLLPWLLDPQWAKPNDSGHTRHNLIYGLSRMKVPESIPGLLHVLQHPEEDDIFEVEYAADALSQFNDPVAAPTLRFLLSSDIAQDERVAVARALLKTGAVNLEEKVAAVAAFARQIAQPAGREQLSREERDFEHAVFDPDVTLGLAVIQSEGQQSTLIGALKRQSAQLRATAPETANALDAVLAVLPDADRDARLIAAIADGSADADAIRTAIERRLWLSKGNADRLKVLAQGTGAPAAIAAVLLQDEERELAILLGGDVEAQKTLLAVLRLSGDLVHDDAVHSLVSSPDSELAEAARAYWDVLWKWRHTL